MKFCLSKCSKAWHGQIAGKWCTLALFTFSLLNKIKIETTFVAPVRSHWCTFQMSLQWSWLPQTSHLDRGEDESQPQLPYASGNLAYTESKIHMSMAEVLSEAETKTKINDRTKKYTSIKTNGRQIISDIKGCAQNYIRHRKPSSRRCSREMQLTAVSRKKISICIQQGIFSKLPAVYKV